MDIEHTETDEATGVEYRLLIEPEDLPVRGHAIASGDDATDQEYEDKIIERLDNGDTMGMGIGHLRGNFPGVYRKRLSRRVQLYGLRRIHTAGRLLGRHESGSLQ